MEEIWKSYCEFDSRFLISNKGNVKGVTGKLRKIQISTTGYPIVVVCTQNQKLKTFKIHRLVAELFLEKEEDKCVINHIDGNKLNNSVKNLEWVTHSQNLVHAYNTNLRKACIYKKDGQHVKAKRVAQCDLSTKKVIKEFDSVKEASDITGLLKDKIAKVSRGERNHTGGYFWKYLD